MSNLIPRVACCAMSLSAGLLWPAVLLAQQAAAPPPPPATEPWLRVRAELRERVEGFQNAGFVDDRDDLYYLSRLRLGATAAGRWISGTVQVHDARVGDKSIGPTAAPFRAAFDLRQALLELGSAKTPVAARLGRQEIAFGDQRLVGHANWLNSGRTFDAARLTFRTKRDTIDLFAASVVRILEDEFDKSGNGNRFAGAHLSTSRFVPRATIEPYLFWRRDIHQRAESGVVDSLQQTTTGGRLVGRLPTSLDYNLEMALQRGSLAGDSVRAWAGHWQIRETLTGAWLPRVSAEYNFASGDADPTDGVRGTFDQLYPTAHDKYGLADQVGWRNIHHVRAGVELTPMRATSVNASYHSYWLAEARDALYAASGAPIARVIGGAASRRVGQEIDVQVSRPLAPYLALAAGYSHILAGPFLEQATPGKSYSGPFVMVTYVFLADK
jgi:hypothetical protein